MELKELQEKLQGIKKGKWYKAVWKSEKNVNGTHCEKISTGTIRFCEYKNTKIAKQKELEKKQQNNGVVVAKKVNNNSMKVVIKDILYQSANGNLLISAKSTPHKAKSVYKFNGEVVDKETYETLVKPSTNTSGVFYIHLENLISLG